MDTLSPELSVRDNLSRNMFMFYKGVDKDNSTLTFRVCRQVGDALVVVKLWYENQSDQYTLSDLGTIKIWFGTDVSVVQQYWSTKQFSPSTSEAQLLIDGYIRTVRKSLPVASAMSQEVLK